MKGRRDVLDGLEGFTPGTWAAEEWEEDDGESCSVIATIGETERRVAVGYSYQAVANARLIARAPDLVEEVRLLRKALSTADELLRVAPSQLTGTPETYDGWMDSTATFRSAIRHMSRRTAGRPTP